MRIQDLYESSDTPQSNVNANTILRGIHRAMRTLESDYKSREVEPRSSPAAPDTTKFRAERGGMVEFVTDFTQHGSYGYTTRYNAMIKIGGLIYIDIADDITSSLEEELGELAGVGGPTKRVATSDGYIVRVSSFYGTNYGGVGVVVSKA